MFHQMLVRLTGMLPMALAFTVAFMAAPPGARASINWDAEAGSHWWFDPINWDLNGLNLNIGLPPSNSVTPAEPTDTQINIGGPGVVYDPDNDPNFPPPPLDLPPPPGYEGVEGTSIWRLYMGRVEGGDNPAPANLLTIKSGTLTIDGRTIIGRSSGTVGVGVSATVLQTGGHVLVENAALDLGGSDTSHPGYGHGTWDYRGGILETVDVGGGMEGTGLALSSGTSAGNGGHGRFMMHNPSSGGFVRVSDLSFVEKRIDGDGVNTGVGIAEFHYENGGTRAFQVVDTLSINNGSLDGGLGGIGSARLELVLDEAPSPPGEVPPDLPLFDVGFDGAPFPGTGPGLGHIGGVGSFGQYFSSAYGSTLYTPGSIVFAIHGNVLYRWTIDYGASIVWSDADNSVIEGIYSYGGDEGDVVLRGLDSHVLSGLPGDYNGDGTVGAGDYPVWRNSLGQTGVGLAADGTGPDGLPDGVVDQLDYEFWKYRYGETIDSGSSLADGSTNVPEPSSFVLLGLGIVTLVMWPESSSLRWSSSTDRRSS